MILDAHGRPFKRTWAELADTAPDKVCRLPSNQVVCNDERLLGYGFSVADSWVPYQLCRHGTPWTLKTTIGSWTDPASPPVNWAFSTTGGSLTGGLGAGPLLITTDETKRSYLAYTAGALGSVTKMMVVGNWYGHSLGVLGAANRRIGALPIINDKYFWVADYAATGGARYRGIIANVAYPFLLPEVGSMHTHFLFVQKPTIADASTCAQIPSVNNSLVDLRIDGLGAWMSPAGTGLDQFWFDNWMSWGILEGCKGYLYINSCAIYTV